MTLCLDYQLNNLLLTLACSLQFTKCSDERKGVGAKKNNKIMYNLKIGD